MTSLHLSIIFSFLCVFILGCGQGIDKEEQKSLRAKDALNSRNYQLANKLYQDLYNKEPANKEYANGLADSYLGLGGFELFEFLLTIEGILESSFESEVFYFELRAFTEKYFLINDQKQKYLQHAIDIYSRLERSFQNQTKEEMLKKGLVHIFLLTQSIKKIIMQIETDLPMPIHSNDPRDDIQNEYQKFVSKYLVHVDSAIFHSFNAYVNLKASFSEVVKLLLEIDRVLETTFGIPYNRIKDEINNLTLEKLLVLFIKYNPKFYSKLMLSIFKTCDKKVAVVNINLLIDTILKDANARRNADSVLRLLDELKKYILTHDQNICHTHM